jgi:hypothetical protein
MSNKTVGAFEQIQDHIKLNLRKDTNNDDTRRLAKICAGTAELVASQLALTDQSLEAVESLALPTTLKGLTEAGGEFSEAVEHIDEFLKTVCADEVYNNPTTRQVLSEQVGLALTMPHRSHGDFFVTNNKADNSLAQIAGASEAFAIASQISQGLESFGANTDNLPTDTRMIILVTVARAHKGLIERALPRKAVDSIEVKYVTNDVEVFDLSKASASTVAEREGSHRQDYTSLLRDPSAISQTPKKVIPITANDATHFVSDRLKVAQKHNLFDLTADENTAGYDAVNHTDMLAEGGKITTLYLSVTDTVADPDKTEVFAIDITPFAGNVFVPKSNSVEAPERIIGRGEITVNIPGNSNTAADVATVIFDDAGYNFQVKLSYSGELNLRTGDLVVTATVLSTAYLDADGDAAAGAQGTLYDGLTDVEFVSFDSEIYFSEENLRKATIAVRQTRRQSTLEIPPGRVILVDTAHGQDDPSSVIGLLSSLTSLGASDRALNVINSHMTLVNGRNAYEEANTVARNEQISRSYAAGSVALPTVIVDTLDMADDVLDSMRESEKPTELMAKVRARLLSVCAELNAKSLWPTNLEPGEKHYVNVVVHSLLADLIFGIPDYHNALSSNTTDNGGADYAMELANGIIVRVFKTDFDSQRNIIQGMYVRDGKAGDPTNFANTYDAGVYATSIGMNGSGASFRRHFTSPREFSHVTCPVGFKLTVTNLDDHYPEAA